MASHAYGALDAQGLKRPGEASAPDVAGAREQLRLRGAPRPAENAARLHRRRRPARHLAVPWGRRPTRRGGNELEAFARPRSEDGYTLVELLMVMALMGVLMGALTTVFVAGSRAESGLDRYFQAQQQARTALDSIRADVHCATAAQATTINGYPALKLADGSCYAATPTITWCVLPSTQLSGRYALWRSTTNGSTTCTNSDTAQRFEADFLMPVGSPAAASNIVTTPTIAYLGLEAVAVDFKVDVAKTTSGSDAYELADSLVTRNYARCGTVGGCPAPVVT